MDFENINDRHQRLIHIHEFIMKKTGKSAIATRVYGGNKVAAMFCSEDVAKECGKKIDCLEREEQKRIMIKAHKGRSSTPFSKVHKGVKVYGMNENTTIQQLIDHIK